jgi:hypothetical protein
MFKEDRDESQFKWSMLGDIEKSSELYAKVIRPFDTSPKRYLIHFTSVPPGIKAKLRGLASGVGSP